MSTTIRSPFGLRLTLVSDFTHKFTISEPDRVNYNTKWSVLGQYDYWDVQPLHTLNEPLSDDAVAHIPSITLGDSGDPAINHSRARVSVLLFPFSRILPDHFNNDPLAADRLLNPHLHTTSAACHVVAITLSPIAYEGLPNFDAIFGSLSATHSLVRDLASQYRIPRVSSWCSLSSPDYIFISFPRTETELLRCERFALKLANTSLKQLIANTTQDMFPRSHHYPGHAFSKVQPMIAFNGHDAVDGTLHSAHWKNRSPSLSVRITTSVECECGHAVGIAGHFKNMGLGNDVCIGASQAGSLVTVANLDISAYRKVWRTIIKPECRDGNIYRASSEVGYALDIRPHLHGPVKPLWGLTKPVTDDLLFITDAILGAPLGKATSQHLLTLLDVFKSCIQNPETATEAKELLPLFVQFAGMLRDSRLEKYLSPVSGRVQFWDDLRVFLHCFHLALTSRREQRQVLRQPPLLSPLPVGAASLLSAYTAVFYLCWQVFTRDRHARSSPDIFGDECRAENFAGLVYLGRDGKVRCGELFQGFRRHVESITDRPLSVCGDRPVDPGSNGARHERAENERIVLTAQRSWNARLCYLEVPSTLLMRAEEVFVHTLHEAAELSEWSEHPLNAAVRRGFNVWIVEALSHVLCETAEDISLGSSDAQALSSKRSRSRYSAALAKYIASLCNCKQPAKMTSSETDTEVSFRFVAACRELGPNQFYCNLYDAVVAYGTDPTVHSRVESVLCGLPSTAPLDTSQFVDVLHHSLEKVLTKFRTLAESAIELVPDLAMWTAAQRIFAGEESSIDTQIQDLNRIYGGLYRTAREAAPEESRVGNSVLIRWAIMASSLLRGWRRSHSAPHAVTWQQVVLKGLREMRPEDRQLDYPTELLADLEEHMMYAPTLFDSTDLVALDEMMSHFQPFGGVAQVWIGDLEEQFSNAEKVLLKEVKETWRSEEPDKRRLILAFKFWAKAQRLRHERMFETI